MAARRPYLIIEKSVAGAAGQPTAAARRYKGLWPLDRACFEANLSSDAVCSRHWPRKLPDSIPEPSDGTPRLRRHRLRYVWDLHKPLLGVISCNPSRATRRVLDDTLHATVNQADLWGFGGIDQCNLSPVYETNSYKVHSTMDLQDRANWMAIACVLSNSAVWLAWGSIPWTGSDRQAWNAAEDCVLGMVWKRQRADETFTVLANRILKGGGSRYRPPGHPSPRRIPPDAPPPLYVTPLFVSVAEPPSRRRS